MCVHSCSARGCVLAFFGIRVERASGGIYISYGDDDRRAAPIVEKINFILGSVSNLDGGFFFPPGSPVRCEIIWFGNVRRGGRRCPTRPAVIVFMVHLPGFRAQQMDREIGTASSHDAIIVLKRTGWSRAFLHYLHWLGAAQWLALPRLFITFRGIQKTVALLRVGEMGMLTPLP